MKKGFIMLACAVLVLFFAGNGMAVSTEHHPPSGSESRQRGIASRHAGRGKQTGFSTGGDTMEPEQAPFVSPCWKWASNDSGATLIVWNVFGSSDR